MVSATDAYKAVLEELKHYNTTSMTPEEFNYRIWIAEIEYVKNRHWAYEQHQKTIDDLDIIRIVTDGVAGYPAPLVNQGPSIAGQEWVQLPNDYFRLLEVSAQVRYKNVPCKIDGTLSNYIPCTPLKDDKRHAVDEDFYQKPIAEWPNLYYDQRGRRLAFRAGDSIVEKVQLVYLRYPIRIFFDVTGANHVNSEFPWEQTMEIVKLCVRTYLEAIESARTQSNIQVDSLNFSQNPPPGIITG